MSPDGVHWEVGEDCSERGVHKVNERNTGVNKLWKNIPDRWEVLRLTGSIKIIVTIKQTLYYW